MFSFDSVFVRRMPINGFPLSAEGLRSDSVLDFELPQFFAPPAPAFAPPIAMLGVPFDNVTLSETLARIENMIQSGQPHYVVTANVDFLAQAREDAELRRVLLDAHLIICDGMPLVWASRFLKNPLPERVAGADLVPRLMSVAAERNYRVFFLGASRAANERAVANLQNKFPGLQIVGHYSPPFRPLAQMNNEKIIRRVRAARPDLLLVAFGCPKAEKWMAKHHQILNVPVMIGVGATIDFMAGRVKRAPAWMQHGGLEWLFRLSQEPRRLFGRYARDLKFFAGCIADQWWKTHSRLSARAHPPRHCVVSTEGTWTRIQVPERLDHETVRLGEWVWQMAGRTDCLLDLRGVRFMDSTGAALLLRLRKELRAAAKRLVLLSPHPAVKKLLCFMRVHDEFVIVNHISEIEEVAQKNPVAPFDPDLLKRRARDTADLLKPLGKVPVLETAENSRVKPLLLKVAE